MSAPEAVLKMSRVVSATCVREGEPRVTIPVPGHGCADEPRIELVREGEVVRAIDIACPCGRRLRVLCDFPGSATR
ncbi:MAG: hypothetical protein K2W96_26925 [Gemmataceae bacterium]|nr:hypothetical protein [Gemmataceae bacterium]